MTMFHVAVLGTGPAADAYLAAFRFPNLFRRLFAEGAFNTAFIPLFAKSLEQEGMEPARLWAARIMSWLVAAVTIVTVFAEIFMPWVLAPFVPGFLADDELYVNTAKSACNAYLGVEFNYATGVDVPSCGGRAPSYDVIDYSYSMLMAGLYGFDTATLQPKFHDDPQACRAGSAADDPTCANHPPAGTNDTTFPFLAAPH